MNYPGAEPRGILMIKIDLHLGVNCLLSIQTNPLSIKGN